MIPLSNDQLIDEAEQLVLKGYNLKFIMWCQQHEFDPANEYARRQYRRDTGDRIFHYHGTG